jgi:pimeloyl-ACP methyl ester carboxylesterase
MRLLKTFFFWLVLPVVCLLIILILFGQKWGISYLSPPDIFILADAPKAPDFDNQYFWVAHPDKSDTSDLVPVGIDTSDDIANKAVDVFFVHSTGFVGPGGWNSSMQIENSEAQSIEYMLSSMASIFNGCCDIYAPHYREAQLQSFITEKFDLGTQALDLAYQDVEAAFDYYLTHYNRGRPFIVVGHSQGTTHALRLLEQRVDNTRLIDQLVAAYLVGYWLPKDKFIRGFEQIKPCEFATQTGCIVSYDVFGQGGKMDSKVPHWYKTGWEVNRQADDTVKPTLCVNPLNWQSDLNKIPKSQHLGAMPVEFKRTPVNMLLANNPGFIFKELPALTSELTWAQCMEDGRLEIMQQADNAFSNHLEQSNKSYHVLDFSLFYGNIRQNAMQRVNQFMATNSVSQLKE